MEDICYTHHPCGENDTKSRYDEVHNACTESVQDGLNETLNVLGGFGVPPFPQTDITGVASEDASALYIEPYGPGAPGGYLLNILANGYSMYEPPAIVPRGGGADEDGRPADGGADVGAESDDTAAANNRDSFMASILDTEEDLDKSVVRLAHLQRAAEKFFIKQQRLKEGLEKSQESWLKVKNSKNVAVEELVALKDLFNQMLTEPNVPADSVEDSLGPPAAVVGSNSLTTTTSQVGVHPSVSERSSKQQIEDLVLAYVNRSKAALAASDEALSLREPIKESVASQLAFLEVVEDLRPIWKLHKVPYASHVFSESDFDYPYRAELCVEVCHFPGGSMAVPHYAPHNCWPPIPQLSPFVPTYAELYLMHAEDKAAVGLKPNTDEDTIATTFACGGNQSNARQKCETSDGPPLPSAGTTDDSSLPGSASAEKWKSGSDNTAQSKHEHSRRVGSNESFPAAQSDNQQIRSCEGTNSESITGPGHSNGQHVVPQQQQQRQSTSYSVTIRSPASSSTDPESLPAVQKSLVTCIKFSGDAAHFIESRCHMRVLLELTSIRVADKVSSSQKIFDAVSKRCEELRLRQFNDLPSSVPGTTLPLPWPELRERMKNPVSKKIDRELQIAFWVLIDRALYVLINSEACTLKNDQDSGRRGISVFNALPLSAHLSPNIEIGADSRSGGFPDENSKSPQSQWKKVKPRPFPLAMKTEILNWSSEETSIALKDVPILSFTPFDDSTGRELPVGGGSGIDIIGPTVAPSNEMTSGRSADGSCGADGPREGFRGGDAPVAVNGAVSDADSDVFVAALADLSIQLQYVKRSGGGMSSKRCSSSPKDLEVEGPPSTPHEAAGGDLMLMRKRVVEEGLRTIVSHRLNELENLAVCKLRQQFASVWMFESRTVPNSCGEIFPHATHLDEEKPAETLQDFFDFVYQNISCEFFDNYLNAPNQNKK